jgi:CheY-like chemotaxis protein
VDNQNNSQPPRRVLFVDDEADFLDAAKEVFTALSAGEWEVHCASTAEAALEQLKRQNVELAVLNTELPSLDCVRFLESLGKQFPDLKKVALTKAVAEDKRSACLVAGADAVIEKPRSPEGFKSVFAMLDDLMNWLPQRGFQGMLRRVGLPDVIQMECLGRNSSVLEVYNNHVLGRIYIEEGNIIHAAGGDLTGERAFQRLLALPGSSFELAPFEPPQKKTISAPWATLLMEAAHARNDLAAQNLPGDQNVDPNTLAAPASATTHIVETLVCTGAGQPLYEADCDDVPGRVILLKAIARHAEQLWEIAPLGNFDRLELQLANGRVIAQARRDRLVYVAVANNDRPSP